jgi:steroid Delta-isomerase
VTLRLRRAEPEDVAFLVELANHDEVEPFMSARRARDVEGIRAEVERSRREPEEVGTFVIEVHEGDGWRPVGSLDFSVENRRSRIAHLGGLALHPDFRGRRLADEAARRFQRHLIFDLGYHRLELECYAFNERAIRHAERAGYVREGTRRRAYRRHGEWVDGVLFGLVREDIEGIALLHDHVSRFNAGVASGDFGPMLELFAEDAEMVFEGVPIGPFAGRDAIAAAYRESPPDDGLELLDAREEGGLVVAAYAWRADSSSRAGELRLTREGGRIRRLVVTFD